MSGGPSTIGLPVFEKSNIELVNALRSNFAASRDAVTSTESMSNEHEEHTAAAPVRKSKIPYTTWTSEKKGWLLVPSSDYQTVGLAEERSQYDITVKLFFLPKTSPSDWGYQVHEAMASVMEELDVSSVDLLIVSFPGVSFDADSGERLDSGLKDQGSSAADELDAMINAWREIEALKAKGVALQIGIAEFGIERLRNFLARVEYRPTVNQINVQDCCVVPESMMSFAKHESIELLTHNDCTNILPQGTVRELLGDGEKGAGVLAGPQTHNIGLHGDIRPEWVVKYTAVVRDRGVIENKGYFASAELLNETAH